MAVTGQFFARSEKTFWVTVCLLLLAIPAADPFSWAGAERPENASQATDSQITSVESAIASHRDELAALKEKLAALEQHKAALTKQLAADNAENAAHNQLLLAPDLPIESLEKAINTNRLAAKALSEELNRMAAESRAAAERLQETITRIELAREQVTAGQGASLPNDQKQKFKQVTRLLIKVLEEKKNLVLQYQQRQDRLQKQVQQALQTKSAIGTKLAALNDKRIKRSLLTPVGTYHQLSRSDFRDAVYFLKSRLAGLLTRAVWRDQWTHMRSGGVALWGIFLFWLILIVVVQARCRKFLLRLKEKHPLPEGYYRQLTLNLLSRSLLFLGLALLFGIFGVRNVSPLDIGVSRVLSYLFLTLLLTRWGLDYFKFGRPPTAPDLWRFVARDVARFMRILRGVMVAAILFVWAAGKGSLLTWLLRDLLALSGLVWVVAFWRRLGAVVAESTRQGQGGPSPHWFSRIRGWSYLIAGGGLLISLAGYSVLAGHWYLAWIRTAALLFWGWLSLQTIREWRRGHHARETTAGNAQELDSAHHFHGAMIQLVWGLWCVGFVWGLIWAWDSSGLLMTRVKSFLDLSFTVGKLELSFSRILQTVVILFCTHLIVRMGRGLLREKVLAEKAYEMGFKDSILTISGYIGWGLGLILALTTIGVDATSLAVVFGALSVGIGFGLQNIFNNFISGLILLFERPIQVGDIVEVGGIWAEVRKINVRATVVQTFDNASVIIPNSEFISQQVTNWSFKDKRMRRNIEVGVAYGSDIDLVQETLLDIVKHDRDVYKYPKPDVLFIDHAASALIFRLRIWVHVDDYWSVPSRIRYEIDRRFRELNIEIAFPQQDVHVRTLPKNIFEDVKGERSG